MIAAVALAYAAVAASYAALSRRMPARVRQARWVWAVIAIAAVLGAFAAWPAHEGGVLDAVSVTLCVSAMATVFVSLAPVIPRVVWALAVIAPIAAAIVLLR